MRKVVSLLLSTCILIICLLSLASCFHICKFSEEWTSDGIHHWHACTNDKCEKTADKAEHIFGVSEVIVKPTQEADGISSRTCTVCNSKKEQTVLFTGLEWKDWDEAVSRKNFANFTYHERADAKYSGIQVTTMVIYKFTETEVYASITAAGSTTTDTASGLVAAATKEKMIDSIQKLLDHSLFKYDREKKVYILTGTMIIEGVGSATDATLKFENGKPKELVYTCIVYSNGIPMDCTSTITFTDYGTTTID